LSRYGLRREGRKYSLRTEGGDLLVVSFGGRVLVRLGPVPRPEVERLLEDIPTDGMFAEYSAVFKEWVYSRLDSVYGQ
jgi:hypothetical protein